MEKRNALIWGYFAKNLGDDLMLKAFLAKNREKYNKIYINSYKKYEEFYSTLGVSVIPVDSLQYRAVNKIFCFLNLTELYYRITRKKNIDFIMLGGSLFAELPEGKKERQVCNLKYAVTHAKNSYVIGSNFGLYHSTKFLKCYEQIFQMCRSVCFRDCFSYELFSNLPMVKYAPDVILSGEWEEQKKSHCREKSVVISVINLKDRPELSHVTEIYEKVLAEIVRHHVKKGDNVILAAFCETEGDQLACQRIRKMCSKSEAIKIMLYDDFDFLNVLSGAKKIYGSRFHSIILAMYYDIPCVSFVYNEKTNNALAAYCKTFQAIDLLKLSEYPLEEIMNSWKKMEIKSKIREKAKIQLENNIY